MLPSSQGPYAEWVRWLSAFAAGDDADMAALPAIDPETLGGSASAQLSRRCADALSRRLDLWQRAFQRDLDGARRSEELDAALASARRRLAPIRNLTSSHLLFADLRKALGDNVEQALADAQRRLEEQAISARGGGEATLRAVRLSPLTRAIALDLPDESPAPEHSVRDGVRADTSPAPSPRAILL